MPMLQPDHRRPAHRDSSRRRRAFAARLDPLEARVALTVTTALDPTFGSRGVVLGATSTSDTNLSTATAVAVQADGKIVEVGAVGDAANYESLGLAARRYNADGSVDTTFGTNGQVAIPSTATSGSFNTTPGNVAIGPDGSIVFAAVAYRPQSDGGVAGLPTPYTVVVRLTASGQLDSTYGTGGLASIPPADGILTDVAVQADGSVVAAGSVLDSDSTHDTGAMFSVIRLTPTGAPDTTFNTTGLASVVFPTPGQATAGIASGLDALALTPGGQILIGGNQTYTTTTGFAGGPILAELQEDGTPNSAFGTGGMLTLTEAQSGILGALAVQPDGGIVVAGLASAAGPTLTSSEISLFRLTANGSVDPTFARVSPANPGSFLDAVDVRTPLALGADGSITVGESSPFGNPESLFVARYLNTGTIDTSFGLNGRAALNITSTFLAGSTTTTRQSPLLNDLALTAGGRVVVVGLITDHYRDVTNGQARDGSGDQAFLAQLRPIKTVAVANDYDGDGKADIAGVLGAFGLYAYRPSDGTQDVLAGFGPATVGAAIPAPGDYDGDGRADIAAYFPAYGALVYRPSSGGADVVVPFGIAGAGNTIPAPGDYDGDGKTDVAAYFPSLGEFVYRPSTGGSDVVVPFGIPGTGGSIPAPGDYDGDGRTDLAVYIPSIGAFAYRPSAGGQDVITQFGIAGSGASIPAPGDYDGDGKTDLAVYIPSLGDYAYRPSSGGADVITQFGIPGSGASIPAPGDYDGDGKTDLAVYLPSIGYLAERPSSGGADVLSQFGASGTMQTVPAASIGAAFATTSTGTVSSSAAGGSTSVHDLALTDDLASAEVAQARRRKRVGA